MIKLRLKKIILISLACVSSFALVSCSYKPKQAGIEKAQANLVDKKASEEDMDFPSHDPSLVSGKEIYAKNCATCHGSTPSNHFSKEGFRAKTPQQQYITLTKGNIKGMPAFRDKLTREERWDALMYVRANVLGYFTNGTDDYARINAIFGGNCAVCHGNRGDGDGPLHKELDPAPANFNDFERLYTRSDDKLFQRVSHGIAWTAMPAWKDRYDFDKSLKFDDELRWQLVRYVRQFGFTQEVDRLELGREELEKFKEQTREGAK